MLSVAMRLILRSLVTLTAFSCLVSAEEAPTKREGPSQHPAIGSWYGKAVQMCPEPLSACPKAVLTMTPTMTSDGHFLGNDTFAIAGAPFGPHTTAHGIWLAVSPTKITADYVFMNIAFPPGNFPSTGAARFRWQAEAVDDNTMVGFVNFWPGPPVPTVWESLPGPNDFPTLPQELREVVVCPKTFVTDPKQCTFSPQCPLIFKFKILRVQGPTQ
jgi:hypothetical protein